MFDAGIDGPVPKGLSTIVKAIRMLHQKLSFGLAVPNLLPKISHDSRAPMVPDKSSRREPNPEIRIAKSPGDIDIVARFAEN